MSRYYNPVAQYVDTDSQPLSGGKIFFYEAGTTTPKDTFADPALTVPNANPVILDNSGTIPDIYLADDAPYFVQIFRSNGVLFQQADNVTGVGSGGGSGGSLTWDATVTYNIPDVAYGSDAKLYQTITNGNIGNDPISSPTFWTEFTHLKIWNINETYIEDFIVQQDGILYRSRIPANGGNDPSISPTQWANISGIGYRTLWIPASAMIATVGNAPQFVINNSNTNSVTTTTYNFSSVIGQSCQFSVQMPSDWDSAESLIFQFLWSAETADTDSVKWSVSAFSLTDGDPIDSSFGTPAAGVIDANNGNKIMNFAGTFSYSPIDADPLAFVQFKVERVASAPGDDLGEAARLHGLRIIYKTTSSVSTSL